MALELAVVSLCMRQAQHTQLCSINYYGITLKLILNVISTDHVEAGGKADVACCVDTAQIFRLVGHHCFRLLPSAIHAEFPRVQGVL